MKVSWLAEWSGLSWAQHTLRKRERLMYKFPEGSKYVLWITIWVRPDLPSIHDDSGKLHNLVLTTRSLPKSHTPMVSTHTQVTLSLIHVNSIYPGAKIHSQGSRIAITRRACVDIRSQQGSHSLPCDGPRSLYNTAGFDGHSIDDIVALRIRYRDLATSLIDHYALHADMGDPMSCSTSNASQPLKYQRCGRLLVWLSNTGRRFRWMFPIRNWVLTIISYPRISGVSIYGLRELTLCHLHRYQLIDQLRILPFHRVSNLREKRIDKLRHYSETRPLITSLQHQN